MGSNKVRTDVNLWKGVPYVMDPLLAPDTFQYNPLTRMFHIGVGTDLHARLFWINLTQNDRAFLKHLHIDPDG